MNDFTSFTYSKALDTIDDQVIADTMYREITEKLGEITYKVPKEIRSQYESLHNEAMGIVAQYVYAQGMKDGVKIYRTLVGEEQ